jgi:divinyl protochlorophyllide a 8-vinyl-reductase
MSPVHTTSTEHRARSGSHGAHGGVIGPNAVIQLAEALRRADLDWVAHAAFAEAEAEDWLALAPAAMVDERKVALLHQLVRGALPADQAIAVMREAGRLTADYLLSHRIPRAAQAVLKLLPPMLATLSLVPAIRAHAWTFAGSGQFSAHAGTPTVFEVVGNPLCAHESADQPVCVWHAAVFERLFAVLVSPQTRVVETACAARRDPCCRFIIDWRRVASCSHPP